MDWIFLNRSDASLTIGLPTHTAIMVGFAGACCWIIHAIARDDKPLLFVNTAVLALHT